MILPISRDSTDKEVFRMNENRFFRWALSSVKQPETVAKKVSIPKVLSTIPLTLLHFLSQLNCRRTVIGNRASTYPENQYTHLPLWNTKTKTLWNSFFDNWI